MDLSIAIVSWNTRDLLAECLSSIYALPPAARFEVIVVDNGSSDGSGTMVRKQYPQVLLIENAENPGFAVANNQAIERSSGQMVLLLNPDTVVQRDALDALLTFMDSVPDAGAAGSMLLNPDGTLQVSCAPAPTLGRELWRLAHLDRLYPVALYPMERWPTDRPRAVDTAQGASLIVRRAVIDTVGGLDETYFMYSEEVDWCERIRAARWRIYWVPQSRLVHYGGQSTRQVAGEMFLQLYRAKIQYFRKHSGRLHGRVYKGELLLASVARIAMAAAAWPFQPAHRQERSTLAQQYGRLILALPRM